MLLHVPTQAWFTYTYGQPYINSNWSNVEFTTGAGATGTVLHAWVEGNASGAPISATTPVWVNLPSGIGASSSVTIYMNFMPGNVMNATCAAGANPETSPSTCFTGEAPNLSSTYAHYDNGVSVFPFYDDFAGTSLSSQWTVNGGWSYTVNNEALITYSPGGGVGITSSTTFAYPFVVDFYGSPYLSSAPPFLDIGIGSSGATGLCNADMIAIGLGSAGTPQQGSGCNQVAGTSFPHVPGIFTIEAVSASQANYFEGYNGEQTLTAYLPSSPQPVGLAEAATGGGSFPTPYPAVYWIRERAYPPNGAWPGYSFGAPA